MRPNSKKLMAATTARKPKMMAMATMAESFLKLCRPHTDALASAQGRSSETGFDPPYSG